MPRGGARPGSGPAKDPSSGRSEKAGYTLTNLPNTGYAGRPPGLTPFIPKPTARHRELWVRLWKTPQAWAWASMPWCWSTVADLVAVSVKVEQPDAPAALYERKKQLRDELGLSTAGLRFLGWAIAPVEVGPKPRAAKKAAPTDEVGQRRQRRLRDA